MNIKNPFIWLACFTILFCLTDIKAQNVAITDDVSYTPDPSAMLDIKSTTKGMLIPRLTTLQRTSISSPVAGLMVYDTNLKCFYLYNGTAWTHISSGGNTLDP